MDLDEASSRLQTLERDVLRISEDVSALATAVATINQTTLSLLRQLEKAVKAGLDTAAACEKLQDAVGALDDRIDRLQEVIDANADGRHLKV